MTKIRNSETRRQRTRLPSKPLADVTWVAPIAKDRNGTEIDEDDATIQRDQRRLKQRQKHREVIKSLDVVVCRDGFLVPRVKPNDDSSDDNEDAIDGGTSVSSTPYCRLSEEAPKAPSSHRLSKSQATVATESMTVTVGDSIASPWPQSASNSVDATAFQSPGSIPTDFFAPFLDNQTEMVSPLPDPSPGFGKMRSTVDKFMVEPGEAVFEFKRNTTRKKTRRRSLYSIPGITSPSDSTKDVDPIDPTDSIPKTPTRKDAKLLRRSDSSSFGSPASKTSKLAEVAKTMKPSTRPKRNSPVPKARLIRNRSDSSDLGKSFNPRVSPARIVQRASSDSGSPELKPRHTGRRKSSSLTWSPAKHIPKQQLRPLLPKRRSASSGNISPLKMKDVTSKARNSFPTYRPTSSPRLPPSIPRLPVEDDHPVEVSESSRMTASTIGTGPTWSSSTGHSTLCDSTIAAEDDDIQETIGIEGEEKSWIRNLSRRMSKSESVRTGTSMGSKSCLSSLQDIDDMTVMKDSVLAADDVSEAGAVIIKTRKVPRRKSVGRSKK